MRRRAPSRRTATRTGRATANPDTQSSPSYGQLDARARRSVHAKLKPRMATAGVNSSPCLGAVVAAALVLPVLATGVPAGARAQDVTEPPTDAPVTDAPATDAPATDAVDE